MREIHRPPKAQPALLMYIDVYADMPCRGDASTSRRGRASAWLISRLLGTLGLVAIPDKDAAYLPMQNELKIAPSKSSLV